MPSSVSLPSGSTVSSSSRLAQGRAFVGRGRRVLRRIEPFGQGVVLLALRLLYGGRFAQTGWGKLAHLDRTTAFFQSLGLPSPGLMAMLVGGTELVGGVLLVLGLGTRFAATALTTVMLTAMASAHAAEAFQSLDSFTEQAPYPFLVATVVLLAFGAGRLSLDALAAWWRSRGSSTGA